MNVRLAVLADAANVSQDGKLNILGEFNVLYSSVFPTVLGRMFVVLKIEAEGKGGRKMKLRIRVLDADAHVVAPEIEGEVDLGVPFRPGIPRGGPIILEIRNAVFPRPEAYEFEATIDGERIASIPLYVLPLDGPPAPAG